MRGREKAQGLERGSIGRSDLKAWELCVAGGCSGMAYNSESRRLSPSCLTRSETDEPRRVSILVVLFPADTIKSAIQTNAELRPDLAASHRASFVGTAKEIFAARGIKGLYAG